MYWVCVGNPNDRPHTVSGQARRYKWADATPGNQLARRHGLYSADRSEQVAAEVEAMAEQVAERFPWTAAYADERRAYARALVDEREIHDYLDQVGPLDKNHHERPAVRTAEKFSARAARCRAALGLSPMAHARLLALVAEVVRQHPERTDQLDRSLDALLAEGRAALLRGAERPGLPAAHQSADVGQSEEETQP